MPRNWYNVGQIADVAQLVEQDFRKVKVGGSIPLIGLILLIHG